MLNIASFFFVFLLYGNTESKLHYCRNGCQFPLNFDQLLHIPDNVYCPRVLDDVCNVVIQFDYTNQKYTVAFSASSTYDPQAEERVVYAQDINIVQDSIKMTVGISCLYDDDCDYTQAEAQIRRMTKWRYNGKSILSKLRPLIGYRGNINYCIMTNGDSAYCSGLNAYSCILKVDNLNKTVVRSCSSLDGGVISIIDSVGYPNISSNRQSSTTYQCTGKDSCNTFELIDQINTILLDFDLRNADGTLAKENAAYQKISSWTTIGSTMLITIFINFGVFSRFI
jgi:hypothetical protein